MGKNKILLLDMYGVIIKESKGFFVPYTFRHFAKSEHERLMHVIREDQYFTKTQLGELTSDEFLQYLGYTTPKVIMEDYLINYLTLDEQFYDFAQKYKGIMDFCLLSNDVLEWSEFLTDYHQLNTYFKEKIVSGEAHLRKPDKQIFWHTLDKLQCRPEECIFVDNSVKNLLVAEEVGMNTILFNRDGEEYDGVVVNDFVELGKVLEKEYM